MISSDNEFQASELPLLDLATVERQVQQTGAYSVLEWLLESALLPYPAYERWREGDIPYLEAAIEAPTEGWLQRLREGEAHARSLRLVHEAQTYYNWRPGHGERALALSLDPTRRTLLAQRWARSADLAQLDLFLDNGASAAENDLRRELAARNTADAEQSYERLCRIAPNHSGLGEYEVLVLYARHLQQAAAIPPEACTEEMKGLLEDIAPLAHACLRAQARDYLAPAWRRLAGALPRDRFDPVHPDLHASYAELRIPDWDAVIASVQAVPAHAEHAALLSRLALALQHRNRPEAAMLTWARCSELAPDQSPADLTRDASPRLYRHALCFADLDAPLDTADFPAWLLLQEPGLLHHLKRPTSPVPVGATFLAVAELLQTRARGTDEVAARRRLQELRPPLLRAYLDRGSQ
ncbi:hypothetical protein [Thioalkalivibrio sp.]|uniref:hypothetical protein n=1 Tax=Thioalkalivibrio sp. TaxID=2093813 RepID=UPI0012D66A49|nr:hypothetical protein [Thioalkalivibrio sp.]TVP80809.1 MAG: hypothetical protein EA346_06695 [Thioalkalivibrio sp.]